MDAPPPILPPVVTPPPTASAPPREPLKRIPLPPYVAVLLVVTGISFVLGLTRLPGSLSQAIRFDRGSARVEKGDVSGVDDMAEVYRHLDDPNSQARLDMANAYLKAGRKEESAKIIESMVGMKLDSKELERAKEIGAQAGANVN